MKDIHWQLVTASPALLPGEVHVWRADLNLSASQLTLGREMMSPEERERADRMVTQVLRDRRVAGQSILRDVVARYLHISPAKIVFDYGERGKPSVLGGELQFNLSHTEDMALVAITLAHPIGVDIESIKISKYHQGIVEKNYSAEEFAQYQALPESERLEAFFRAWTRKEAYIKAIGQGLYYPLENFTVDLCSVGDQGLLSIEGSTERARSWCLPSFKAAEKFMASVAIEAEIKNWVFWDWKDFSSEDLE